MNLEINRKMSPNYINKPELDLNNGPARIRYIFVPRIRFGCKELRAGFESANEY